MGCYYSTPHSQRRYRDADDSDEGNVHIREFGKFRNGSTNLVPDDIEGLPSTHTFHSLATSPSILLYEAEIDQGSAFRCFRIWPFLFLLSPVTWLYLLTKGLGKILITCTCDQMCCWLRKEYSSRSFFRVYSNRIEVNNPHLRVPWGVLGCGSWSSDNVMTHPFDRGAFGFRSVECCSSHLLCCTWPVFGGVVARQRCPCNGSLWPRLLDCGGWWCDEWLCDACFCTYKYYGIADPEETSFAAGIALQAFFEGRAITKEEMEKCLTYWRQNISEMDDPVGRKRHVCCEPFRVPCCSCTLCYEVLWHPQRNIPFDAEDPRCTDELIEVYTQYAKLREKQIHTYKTYTAPVKKSTLCTAFRCRRVFGRRGFIFCTESCLDCDPNSTCCSKKKGDPAPPFKYRDIDDENDASIVLRKVLGDAPPNVRYRRWEWHEEEKRLMIVVHGNTENVV